VRDGALADPAQLSEPVLRDVYERAGGAALSRRDFHETQSAMPAKKEQRC
jgi:hypothetical protein